jgi:hypothetical protein
MRHLAASRLRVIAIVTGAAAGVALAFVMATNRPASGVTCGATTNAANYQTDATHRGAYSGDFQVYSFNNPDNAFDGSTNVHCSRVATLDVFHASDEQLEIGYHITPNNSGVCPIDTSNPQQPFFTIIKTVPGQSQICVWSHAVRQLSTGSKSFKEVDPNKTGDWDFYLDGSKVEDGVTTWTQGWIVSNGEHHNTASDSAYSNFDQLKYIDGSGAHAWDASACFFDNSGHYDGNKVSNDPSHIVVNQPSSRTC